MHLHTYLEVSFLVSSLPPKRPPPRGTPKSDPRGASPAIPRLKEGEDEATEKTPLKSKRAMEPTNERIIIMVKSDQIVKASSSKPSSTINTWRSPSHSSPLCEETDRRTGNNLQIDRLRILRLIQSLIPSSNRRTLWHGHMGVVPAGKIRFIFFAILSSESLLHYLHRLRRFSAPAFLFTIDNERNKYHHE